MFKLFDTLSITQINQMGLMPEGVSMGVVTALGLLLLLGAMGKSAQAPLMVWLPDAMAGPTPVSAQIHAATMVTAGVYLLMRMFPLIGVSIVVVGAIAVTGAFTAFYGATCAMAERDLKANSGLFHYQPDRLYDAGRRQRGDNLRDFSSDHPCLFQGPAVSWGWLCHQRHACMSRIYSVWVGCAARLPGLSGRFSPAPCVLPGCR